MTPIESMTAEQSAQLDEYRDRYFAQATSTAPADRPRAEAAARRLAEIGGIQVQRVIWIADPREVLSGDSFGDSLWASLQGSLWASLRDPLRDSLLASLRASLWDSLRDSLRDSLWAALRDSGWLCYYAAARDVLGVRYEDRAAELLLLYEEVAASCFALWFVPGAVILCERPDSVQIEGEGAERRLTGITFREPVAKEE